MLNSSSLSSCQIIKEVNRSRLQTSKLILFSLEEANRQLFKNTKAKCRPGNDKFCLESHVIFAKIVNHKL